MDIKQQLRKLNAFGFFTCLRIPDAVWVVLLAARGFSLWQIGLAEGIFHGVSLLCEIPSGMAADLMGRRRSLAAGGLCGMVSALLMAFGEAFFGVCLAMAFSALACNFISGSDEALLYDSLIQTGREKEYLSVSACYTQTQNLGGMLSNLASLLAGVLSYIGFYLTDAAVCLVRMGTALSLVEPAVTETQADRQKEPFRQLGMRLWEHIRQVWSFLCAHPRTAALMLADGFMCLPGYLTLMFLQQRLSELGLAAMWLGIPVMGVSLARMVGVAIGKYLRPRNLRSLYGMCALLVGAGTVLAGAAPMLPAVLGAMAAAGSMDAWMLHFQQRLNELFPSDRRATLVSVNAMAYSLLMIGASPLVGWLGDIGASSGAGLCVLGGVAVAAGAAVLALPRR